MLYEIEMIGGAIHTVVSEAETVIELLNSAFEYNGFIAGDEIAINVDDISTIKLIKEEIE